MGLSFAPPPLQADARIWVACSGGLDSTVLLHALQAQGLGNLHAVHVHHGLQAAADDWVKKLRRDCRALGVPLRVKKVVVPARHAQGPEAAAREARYAALQSLLRAQDLLVTAHHQDDQAETVLLRALRGSGIAGLAAMAPLQALPRGRLWRPLLKLPRERLLAYAQAQQLSWVEDPHNQQARYARSYLRQEILPRLQPHWPQARTALAQLAGQAAEAAGLLAELADHDLAPLLHGAGWSVSGLLALSPPRRRNALYRLWTRRYGQLPAARQLTLLERELLRARADAEPLLRHAQGEWRRYRDTLYALPAMTEPPADYAQTWAGQGELLLPEGCGRLRAAHPQRRRLRVQLPRGGERFCPEQAAGRRTLKNLFQELGVPVWVRRRTPLLYEDGELIWIGGLGWRADYPAARRLRQLVWLD